MGLFAKMKEKRETERRAAERKAAICGRCLDYIIGEEALGTMFLREKGIEFAAKDESLNPGFRAWREIKSITVEDATELESRITATRLLLLGVFALAAKKKTGGTKYIVVEGENFIWPMEVSRKKAPAANQFVMKARSLMKAAR